MDSISNAAFMAVLARSTGCVESAVSGRSAAASVSIWEMSCCIRLADSCELSTQRRTLPTGASGFSNKMALFARITDRGVFRSWEASAMNCFSRCMASSIGLAARAESLTLTAKNSSMAPSQMASSTNAEFPMERVM